MYIITINFKQIDNNFPLIKNILWKYNRDNFHMKQTTLSCTVKESPQKLINELFIFVDVINWININTMLCNNNITILKL